MREQQHDLGARLSWAAIAVVGGTLVVASFLPAFDLAIVADTGPAAESFTYARELAFAVDLRPFGLVPLVAGLLVVAAGTSAVLRRPPWWLAVGSLAVALGLAWFVIDTSDRLQWSEGGVIGYDEPRAGPLLQSALDDLQADARLSPEAHDPTWALLGGENAYASRGLTGWTVLAWATQALAWLTGYRVARLAFSPWAATALVLAATVVFWVWLFFWALAKSGA